MVKAEDIHCAIIAVGGIDFVLCFVHNKPVCPFADNIQGGDQFRAANDGHAGWIIMPHLNIIMLCIRRRHRRPLGYRDSLHEAVFVKDDNIAFGNHPGTDIRPPPLRLDGDAG